MITLELAVAKSEVRRRGGAIADYMTPHPEWIASSATVGDAYHLMRDRAIRHLPVFDRGVLVGLVSQRDLYLAEDPQGDPVGEVMDSDPYVVTPETPLADVAASMAETKRGAAVVVEGRRVVGVFTTVDALRVLAALAGEANDSGGQQ